MSEQHFQPTRRRLDSWKAIAAYLQRDVRTVQRWEKTEGLPVHRLQHRRRSTPYCFTDELDLWLGTRSTTNGTASTNGRASRALLGLATPGWILGSSVAVVLLAVFAITAMREVRSGAREDGLPPTRGWILVAEFECSIADPHLGETARELVMAELAESPLVDPISRQEIARGLQLAMKPDARVMGEVARELAIRAGAPSYVEGRIDRVGTDYSIVLRLQQAESGRHLELVQATSHGKENLLRTLGNLARKLRTRLGEHEEQIRGTRESHEVITPSLDAYQDFVRAHEAHTRELDHDESIRLLRQALQADRDFAQAWFSLGKRFWVTGMPDSARIAWLEALQRPTRLTEAQLEHARGTYESEINHDYMSAVRHLRRALRLNPPADQRSASLNALSIALEALGRNEEAADALEQALETRAFGPDEILRRNLFLRLLFKQLPSRAEQILPRMAPKTQTLCRRELALHQSDWPAAAALCGEIQRDATFSADHRTWAAVSYATTLVGRGAVLQALESLQNPFEEVGGFHHVQFSQLAHAFLAEALNLPPPSMTAPSHGDTWRGSWLMDGFTRSFLGDKDASNRARATIEKQLEAQQDRHVAELDVLRASGHFARKEWDKVVALLEPVAMQGPILHYGRLPVRWILANALEASQQWDQAARAYEMVLDTQAIDLSDTWVFRGVLVPLAHLRLARIHSQLGEGDSASKHFEALIEMWTMPDDITKPILEEAREALTRLDA